MDDRSLMAEAIRLAVGTQPHPNPRVGALVVDSAGSVVGRGAHLGRGTPHAERLALQEAGDRAEGGTVVVSLEPCDHTATTPPCTEALIEAGVVRVVIGAGDPDSRVSGRGIAALRAAGVEVVTDVASDLVEAIDPGYFHHRRTGRPRVTLKIAMTLDGQVAAADGTSQWITSAPARIDAHRLRAESDAVIVGAATVRIDDPRLTVRLDDFAGRQPRPVVVAGSQPLPPERAIWGRDPLVYAPAPIGGPHEAVVVGTAGHVDLESMIDDLGKREYVDVLVEGGATLAGNMWRLGLVDRLVVYVGGMVGGGVGLPSLGGVFATIADATRVRITAINHLGPDLRIDSEVV